VGAVLGRLAAIAAAAVTAGLMAGPAVAASQRPNVVVVETDDQTAEAIWAMPHVRHLIGRQGVTFDNSFVSYSLCCPSRATFLTGQYAHNHDVFGNTPPEGGYYKLRGSSTLPVWLRAAGYRTILVGKYLNQYGQRDETDVPPGWTDWHGLIDPTTYHYYQFRMNENGRPRRYPPTPPNYQTYVETRKAVNLIGHASHGRRPFFLWYTPLAPHHSYDAPEPDDPQRLPTPVPAPPDRDKFADAPLPKGPSFNEADVSDKPVTIRQYHPLDHERVAAIKENYQQELETLQAVDRGVVRIIGALRRNHVLGHTYVVFTSDNGYFHGEHRVPFGKVLPYEPSIRVPLMIRGPGLPRGVHRSRLVSNQDLAPTILAATGVRPGLVQDGLSLFPLMRHRKLAARDLLIEGLDVLADVRFAGVRTPRWFYAEYTNGERELYDLRADPDETTSRAFDSRYAAVESDLAKRLAALRDCRGKGCLRHTSRRGVR
jgi:arylsulfatase A-like enzyme